MLPVGHLTSILSVAFLFMSFFIGFFGKGLFQMHDLTASAVALALLGAAGGFGLSTAVIGESIKILTKQRLTCIYSGVFGLLALFLGFFGKDLFPMSDLTVHLVIWGLFGVAGGFTFSTALIDGQAKVLEDQTCASCNGG